VSLRRLSGARPRDNLCAVFGRYSNEAFQARTEKRLIARTGCSPQAARSAAVALHPFSSRPESRALEKAVRRASRAFAPALRRARDEPEVLAAARPVVEGFGREARAPQELLSGGTTYEYEWRKALDDATPVDPGAAEVAARADALTEAIPPEQRGIDLHPDVDPEHKRTSPHAARSANAGAGACNV
jgi:hypothetical protein